MNQNTSGELQESLKFELFHLNRPSTDDDEEFNVEDPKIIDVSNVGLRIVGGNKLFADKREPTTSVSPTFDGIENSSADFLDKLEEGEGGWTEESEDETPCDSSATYGKLQTSRGTQINTPSINCDQCDIRTVTLYQMKRHIKLTHIVKQKVYYFCDHCEYKSDRRYSVTRHTMKVHFTGTYKCDQCNYEGLAACQLRRHILTHSGKRLYYCDLCEYITDRKYSLNQHKMIHTKYDSLRCVTCWHKFKSTQALRVHMEHDHAQQNEGSLPYFCTKCSYRTDTAKKLEDHIYIFHGFRINGSVEKKADLSPFTLKTGQSAVFDTDHRNSESCSSALPIQQFNVKDLEDDPAETWNLCDTCGHQTGDPQEFTEHILTHAEMKYHQNQPESYQQTQVDVNDPFQSIFQTFIGKFS